MSLDKRVGNAVCSNENCVGGEPGYETGWEGEDTAGRRKDGRNPPKRPVFGEKSGRKYQKQKVDAPGDPRGRGAPCLGRGGKKTLPRQGE